MDSVQRFSRRFASTGLLNLLSAVDDALYFLVWHSAILTQSDCIKHEVRWLVIDRPFELVLARSNRTIQAGGFVFGPTHGDSCKIPARELGRNQRGFDHLQNYLQ